jgi:hypothetical protein
MAIVGVGVVLVVVVVDRVKSSETDVFVRGVRAVIVEFRLRE